MKADEIRQDMDKIMYSCLTLILSLTPDTPDTRLGVGGVGGEGSFLSKPTIVRVRP